MRSRSPSARPRSLIDSTNQPKVPSSGARRFFSTRSHCSSAEGELRLNAARRLRNSTAVPSCAVPNRQDCAQHVTRRTPASVLRLLRAWSKPIDCPIGLNQMNEWRGVSMRGIEFTRWNLKFHELSSRVDGFVDAAVVFTDPSYNRWAASVHFELDTKLRVDDR